MFGWFSAAEQPFCFCAFEACQPLGVLREGGGENLYRDFAVQLRIARFVDFTHTSSADRSDDLVRAQTSPRSESHIDLSDFTLTGVRRDIDKSWITGKQEAIHAIARVG